MSHIVRFINQYSHFFGLIFLIIRILCDLIRFLEKHNTKKSRCRMMRQILFIALNDSLQKIIAINRPLEEFLDSNGFVIIGITDFLLRFIK